MLLRSPTDMHYYRWKNGCRELQRGQIDFPVSVAFPTALLECLRPRRAAWPF